MAPPRDDYSCSITSQQDCATGTATTPATTTAVPDASSIATDGRVKRLERLLAAASEHALVAGRRLRGPSTVESESEVHRRNGCSSAHASPGLCPSNQGSADYCYWSSGRRGRRGRWLQIERNNQSIIALHWRPALAVLRLLPCTSRRQRSERRSPSTDFALPLPPGSSFGPPGPGTHSARESAARRPAQEHTRQIQSPMPPVARRRVSARHPIPRLARRGLTFLSADVQACCLPSTVVFLLYRPHRHLVSLSPSRTQRTHPRSLLLLPSLVPLPFQAVHQLRHPFPLASA